HTRFSRDWSSDVCSSDLFESAHQCKVCHADYGETEAFHVVEPYKTWVASMMGQAARDPLFYAGVTIANQDAAGAGEYCIRCHVRSEERRVGEEGRSSGES